MDGVLSGKSFWDRMLLFLVEVIEVTETLAEPGDGRAKKRHALELVDRWYRACRIRIPYLPRPVERWVVRKIASGLIDSLVDLLQTKVLETKT